MQAVLENSILSHCSNCWVQRVLSSRCNKRWLQSSQRYYSVKTKNHKSHYEILGVSKTASKREIKEAFVSLSKKLHPDRNPDDPNTHDKFVALNKAYTILTKPSSRKEYDYQQNVTKYSSYSQTQRKSTYHKDDSEWYQRYDYMSRDKTYQNMYGDQRTTSQHKGTTELSILMAVATFFLGAGCVYFYVGFRYVKGKKHTLDKQQQIFVQNLADAKARADKYSTVDRLKLLSDERKVYNETNLGKQPFLATEDRQSLNKVDRASLE